MALEVNKLTLMALRISLCVSGGVLEDGEKLKLKTGSSDIYKSSDYSQVHNLVANTELRSVSDLFERATTAAVIFELVEKRTEFFTIFQGRYSTTSSLKEFRHRYYSF